MKLFTNLLLQNYKFYYKKCKYYKKLALSSASQGRVENIGPLLSSGIRQPNNKDTTIR